MKLWDKGIELDKRIEAYTVGNDYRLDLKLVPYDCQASMAHAKMLAQIGILKQGEATKLISELQHIADMAQAGEFQIGLEQEDCHTAIEEHLTAKLGDLGRKIHTGRSRNDQVLTALRLYHKDALGYIATLAEQFIAAVETFAGKHGDVPLPGFTHTRKAMPSAVGMWAGVFSACNIKERKTTLLVTFRPNARDRKSVV